MKAAALTGARAMAIVALVDAAPGPDEVQVLVSPDA